MSKSDKHVRDLSQSDYDAARRKIVRDEPRADLAPSERPLPSSAMMMTEEEYANKKRAILARQPKQ